VTQLRVIAVWAADRYQRRHESSDGQLMRLLAAGQVPPPSCHVPVNDDRASRPQATSTRAAFQPGLMDINVDGRSAQRASASWSQLRLPAFSAGNVSAKSCLARAPVPRPSGLPVASFACT
jgi:hypothetical protein